MSTKEKKKSGSSSKAKSSSSSSKKDSRSKEKKKKSSSKRSSKSRSPSKSRKRAADREEQRDATDAAAAGAAGATAVPPPVLPPHQSSAHQQDPKPSSDFEAGLLFQRFARNGGVDAKDFQRVWREREQLFSDPNPAPGGEVRRREEASRPGGEARQEGRREGGAGGVGPEKIFEFGQLFQKFDTDGDGRLGRAEFERMVGGMLEQFGERGGDGTRRGSRGGEGDNSNAASAAPQPPPPPPPPALPQSPVGPSITHYDETTGVPLAREAVASQQALGHTVVPLREAHSRRLSRLQSLASSRLMPVRERLLQLRRRLHGRGEELRAARAAIERETLADAEAIVERLRSAETLKQATLAQGVNSVTAELEGVEKLCDQVARVTLLPSSTPGSMSPSAACAPDFEGTERMVELVQSYRELCNSIDRVANKPFDPSIDVQADDFPHETAERLEVLRRADRYEHALSVKDQMLWEAMQGGELELLRVAQAFEVFSESQRLEEKCQEERSLGHEFAEEAQEWVTLTGKLSDRVNALTVETERTAQLRKENALLARENQELARRLETLERDSSGGIG